MFTQKMGRNANNLLRNSEGVYCATSPTCGAMRLLTIDPNNSIYFLDKHNIIVMILLMNLKQMKKWLE